MIACMVRGLTGWHKLTRAWHGIKEERSSNAFIKLDPDNKPPSLNLSTKADPISRNGAALSTLKLL